MGYEINLGNGEWATGQGGMAMTVTDTDTGVKEAILMGCDRNSPKTAVNKDGLLYDVLPYEPSVTYVDGVGVLSLEPQAINYISYSNNPTPPNWENNGTASVVLNTDISPDGSLNANTISGATGVSFRSNNINVNLSGFVNNSDVCSSVWLKSKGATTVRLIQRRDDGDLVFQDFNITNNWARYYVYRNIGAFTNTQFLIGGSDGDFLFYEAQTEPGVKPTSNIPTNGATATRLADTGFQTPDISKWINSTNFSLKPEQSSFDDGVNTYELGVNNGSFSTATRLSYVPSIGEIRATISKTGESAINLYANNVTKDDFNKTEIIISGTDAYLVVNDDIVDSGTFFGYSEGDLKFVSFDNGQGSSVFYGNIKSIKIES